MSPPDVGDAIGVGLGCYRAVSNVSVGQLPHCPSGAPSRIQIPRMECLFLLTGGVKGGGLRSWCDAVGLARLGATAGVSVVSGVRTVGSSGGGWGSVGSGGAGAERSAAVIV